MDHRHHLIKAVHLIDVVEHVAILENPVEQSGGKPSVMAGDHHSPYRFERRTDASDADQICQKPHGSR